VRSGGDLLALVFLAYLGTIVLTVTSMRARFPLVVPLLPFAGFCVDRLMAACGARSATRIGWFAASLLAAAICVHAPVFDAAQRDRDLAERDHNLGVALLEAGRTVEAAEIGSRLAALHPRSARLATFEAAARAEVVFAELDAGAPRDAERAAVLQECLERLQSVFDDDSASPRERARAAGVAGRIQSGLGQTARAERQLRRAREFMRGDVDLLALHARLLTDLLEAAPTASEDLEAVGESVVADLSRYGDPQGWAARINAALQRR
jgi:hypothetical protein